MRAYESMLCRASGGSFRQPDADFLQDKPSGTVVLNGRVGILAMLDETVNINGRGLGTEQGGTVGLSEASTPAPWRRGNWTPSSSVFDWLSEAEFL